MFAFKFHSFLETKVYSELNFTCKSLVHNSKKFYNLFHKF